MNKPDVSTGSQLLTQLVFLDCCFKLTDGL